MTGNAPEITAAVVLAQQVVNAIREGSRPSHIELDVDLSERLIVSQPVEGWLMACDVQPEWAPVMGALLAVGVILWSEEEWAWLPGPRFPVTP